MQVWKAILKIPQRAIKARFIFPPSFTYTPKFFISTDEFPTFNPFPEPTPPQVQKLDEELKELSQFDDYKEGLRNLIEKKYELAESYFRKVLDLLQADNQEFKPKLLNHVMNKLAIALKIQDKNEELTNLLEDIYFLTSNELTYSYDPTFKALGNLITHYCHTNPSRGAIFIESILEQHKTQPIPLNFLKEVYFYIGTLHLINANYPKSIEYLEECLDLKPNPIFRGMTLHNLACGYWWDYKETLNKERESANKQVENKFQGEKEDENPLDDKDFYETLQKIEKRNKSIIPNLKKAIKSFELLYGDDPVKFPRQEKDKLSPKEFASLSLALNETSEKIDVSKIKIEDMALKTPLSVFSAMKLGEMFYHGGSIEESLFWMKVSLHFSVKTMTMPRTLRSMVIMALINIQQRQYEFAEKLLMDCLEYMQGMQIYNKIVCLEAFAHLCALQDRKYEADEYQKQAEKLKFRIPEWYQRREIVQIPEYHLQ